MKSTALILLAAGNSSRMGSPKQLLEFRGVPLIRHAVETALASPCSPVIVVLGANAERVKTAVSDLPVRLVHNERWSEGMGTSIQAGLREADAEGVDGVVLALADQPMVTPHIYDLLVRGHRTSRKPIVASEYAGTVGVPVYFSREAFPSLFALAPDQGCKGVILRHGTEALRIACPEAEADIDTPGDYERVRAGRI